MCLASCCHTSGTWYLAQYIQPVADANPSNDRLYTAHTNPRMKTGSSAPHRITSYTSTCNAKYPTIGQFLLHTSRIQHAEGRKSVSRVSSPSCPIKNPPTHTSRKIGHQRAHTQPRKASKPFQQNYLEIIVSTKP